MDPIQILLTYLAAQYGMTEEAAAELLFEKSEDGNGLDRTKLKADVNTVLAAKDKERVDKLKKDGVDKTKVFNEAYNKAKKEEAEKVEKILAEKFSIEKKLPLTELIDEIAAMKAPQGVELTEENIKKHPVFINLEKAKNKEIKSLTEKHQQELGKLTEEQTRKATFGKVADLVLTYFDEMKPVLPSDASKASNQKKKFLKEFEGYTYEPIEGSDKDFLIIGHDGKRLEDGHGNPLTLKTFTAQQAEPIFEFAKQDGKGNAGNAGKAGAGAVKIPTNKEEYAEAIFNASTPEERAAIDTAYTGEK